MSARVGMELRYSRYPHTKCQAKVFIASLMLFRDFVMKLLFMVINGLSLTLRKQVGIYEYRFLGFNKCNSYELEMVSQRH